MSAGRIFDGFMALAFFAFAVKIAVTGEPGSIPGLVIAHVLVAFFFLRDCVDDR